jgi:hypothetical protein
MKVSLPWWKSFGYPRAPPAFGNYQNRTCNAGGADLPYQHLRAVRPLFQATK